MSAEDVMDLVCEGLAPQFSFAEVNGRTRVRTPLSYPDGTSVDVFVEGDEDGGEFRLSDLGDALGWLWQQSVRDVSMEEEFDGELRGICHRYGLALRDGALEISADARGLSVGVFILATAVVQVASLYFVPDEDGDGS